MRNWLLETITEKPGLPLDELRTRLRQHGIRAGASSGLAVLQAPRSHLKKVWRAPFAIGFDTVA